MVEILGGFLGSDFGCSRIFDCLHTGQIHGIEFVIKKEGILPSNFYGITFVTALIAAITKEYIKRNI